MKKIKFAAIALFLATPLQAADAPSGLNFKPVATISGQATAKHGFEVRFGEVEVRLRGIEAPHDSDKKKEPGAEKSADNLAGILSLNTTDNLVCFLDGTRAESKAVGVCYIDWQGDGDDAQDIAALQVEMGFALDCPKFSGGMYADAEKTAKETGTDLTSIFELPKECSES